MYNTIDHELPKPSRVGLVQLFNQYFKIASRDFHTQIPAKVLEMDYDKGFVTVQPLIKSRMELNNDEEVETLPVDEVPIMMLSAKRSIARLSLPVKVGDVGILFYAERDTGVYRNSKGNVLVNSVEYAGVSFEGQLAPIGFFPEIFTASANRKIRSDATVLEDGVASVALQENGNITVKNTVATMNIDPAGNYTFNNGLVTQSATSAGAITATNTAATSTILPDGTGTFQNNGCNITATSAGVVNVTAQGALTAQVGGLLSLIGTGGVTLTAGGATMASTPTGAYTIQSPTSIVLTVGNSSISITPSGITLSGPTQSTSIN